MADLKISQLVKANVVNKDDLLYLVQNDTSLNVDAGTLFASISDPTLAGNIILGGNVQVLNTTGTVSITTTRTDLYGGVSADANAIANGSVLPATIYLFTTGVSASGRGLTFANGTPITKTIYVRYKNDKIYLSGASGATYSYPPEDWVGPLGLRPFPTSLSLIKGATYIFDVSDATNTGNIFGLSTSIDGTNTLGVNYTSNVTINGTPGTAGANIIFNVPDVPTDTGGRVYLDLPRGADGQLKVINLVQTQGGRFVLSSNLQNNLAIELKKSGDSAFLMYSSNGWILVGSNPGLVTTFSGTSDDVAEGSKLYFTNARARAAITAGDTSIIYDTANGTIKANATSLAALIGTVGFTGNTNAVNEGSLNLYYTNNRVQSNVIALLPTLAGQGIEIDANGKISANITLLSNVAGDFTVEGNVFVKRILYANGMVINGDVVFATETGANIRVRSVTSNVIASNTWIGIYTANVVESASNLYFTNARVQSNIIALLPSLAGNNITIEANGRISATTGGVSIGSLVGLNTANVAESLSNLYYTNARVLGYVTPLLAAKANISDLTTSNVVERTGNLYFTNARALAAIQNQDASLNNLIVGGNLTVQGEVVTLNTTTVTVEDRNILLANGASNLLMVDDAGISVAYVNANIVYKTATDSFDVNKNLTITGNILPTVGNQFDIGSNDKPFRDLWLYGSSIRFSNSGSISQTSNTIVVTDASNTIIFTANATNKPITSPTGTLTANLLENVPNYTTSNLDEGTNLYFTNARVTAAMQPTVSELRALTSNFAANVLYVAGNGNDANDGRSFGNAFANIHVALAAATAWTTVFVKSGDYRLYNQPVTIPRRVALVGDNLRTTTIRPSQPTVDMFYVENACYVTGITFRDHLSPSAVFSYNPNGSAGTIVTSPYIQNCSSITTTGTGMRVDGRYVTGLRSMVCDAYTQTNEGGIGIHMLNKGYTQLVSVFTICCHIAILCESGGFCSVTNSNASFGNYGLWADGVSEPLYFGKVQTGTTEATNEITISNLNIKPNYGDSVLFANYNQAKCARDTGLIVDSLAFDLAYNSNTQSTFAGLQYWSQVTSAIPNQSPETIEAINFALDLAYDAATGVALGATYQGTETPINGPTGTATEGAVIATLKTLLTDIIANGTVGVTDIIVPNQYPANTNVNVTNAANNIIDNKAFIAAETIGYIENAYPGFFANAAMFLDPANAQIKCSRDVGYILESVTFDLRHGGNRQTVTAGTYYYQYDATDTQINDQIVQTGAAYYFIGGLVDKIIRGNVIANVYQNTVVQNTTAASYATIAEANLLLDDVRLIANIVTFGPNVASEKQPITFTPSSNTNIINATKLVLANKDFIKAEVLEFVNQNWANISNGSGTFYTVQSATNLISNTSVVTVLETINENILANSRVSFHQGSYISSSGHTFEYVGSGTTIATALPYLGGVPIQENEVKELRGGKVYFTSTDQLGDFRIGTGLVINRVDGTITGRTFNKALFAVMTPYMLAIEG